MGKPGGFLILIVLGLLMIGCATSSANTPAASPSPSNSAIPPTATATAEVLILPTASSTSTASNEPKSVSTATSTTIPSLGRLNGTATTLAAIATATSYAAATPPSGKYRPDPALAKAWKDYSGGLEGALSHNFLGWALEPAKQTKMAIQKFGRYGGSACNADESLMIWREDNRMVYFMIQGNFGLHAESCRDWWRSYLDIWQPGDPNNDDLTPPAGLTVPKMGIGKVWRENFYGKTTEGLGFAKGPEEYFTATIQSFEGGIVFRPNGSSKVYVLFNRFEYWTRGGLSWDKVWTTID